MDSESARAYADRLSARYGKTTDPEAVQKYGQYNWRWQQPLSGMISWSEVERCWARQMDCWCHERDEDEVEEVEIVDHPV